MKISGVMKYEQFENLANMLNCRNLGNVIHRGNTHPVRIENAVRLNNDGKDVVYEIEISIRDFNNSLDDNDLYYYKTSVYETVSYFLDYQLTCATCGKPIDHLLAEDYIKNSGNRKTDLKRLCGKCLTICTKCGEQITSINYLDLRYNYIEGKSLIFCKKCQKK